MYKRYKGNLAASKAGSCMKKRPRRPKSSCGNRRRRVYTYRNLRILRFFFAHPRYRVPFWLRDDPSTKVAPEPEAEPEPPKEIEEKVVAKRLKVLEFNLKVKENAKKHRTDEYDCTEEEDENGKKRVQEAVVRRGYNMSFDIKFDRPYEKAKNDMQIIFSYGEQPMTMKGTKASMKLNEGEPVDFKANEWGANLTKVDGQWITVDVHIASNCIIGEWELSVMTKVEGVNKNGKKVQLQYQQAYEVDINIIFNPFCKDDVTYCDDKPGYVEEYVMQDSGFVYKGSPYRISPTHWLFGQFEYGILDATFDIIRKSFKEGSYRDLANPIKVSRALTHAINDNVLVGNWSGEYSDGKEPWSWAGSKKILQEYRKTKSAVKYGQCWVFSGLLTTVCRAIGLPCRSVTNFFSAHDTDSSCTIDKFLVQDDGGDLVKDDFATSDSVWNFHVWNEVYLERHDLDAKLGTYDGWQAIDSTPQELSDGIYACGPASLVAIRNGEVNKGYDTPFVFAEVNSDMLDWLLNENGDPELIEKKKHKVGKLTVTKALGSNDMEDVTQLYKHQEGSEKEREAVKLAYLTSGMTRGDDVYELKAKKVKFNLLHSNDVMIGQDMPIKIKACNNGKHDQKIVSLALIVTAEYYNGDGGPEIIKHRFITVDTPESDRIIGTGKVREFDYTLKCNEYLEKLVEKACIKISLSASVEACNDGDTQFEAKDHTFFFDKPELTVMAPKSVKKGQSVGVTITFKNPLNKPLTNFNLNEDAAAFDIDKDKRMDLPKSVGAGETFKAMVYMKALRVKKSAEMSFILNCQELYELEGSVKVEITV